MKRKRSRPASFNSQKGCSSDYERGFLCDKEVSSSAPFYPRKGDEFDRYFGRNLGKSYLSNANLLQNLKEVRKVLSAIEAGDVRGDGELERFEHFKLGGNGFVDIRNTNGFRNKDQNLETSFLPNLHDVVRSQKETNLQRLCSLSSADTEFRVLHGIERLSSISIANYTKRRERRLEISEETPITFSTLTPQLQKRIARVPKPNEAETKKLQEISSEFVDLIYDQNLTNVENVTPKKSLYGVLLDHSLRQNINKIPPLANVYRLEELSKKKRRKPNLSHQKSNRLLSANGTREDSRAKTTETSNGLKRYVLKPEPRVNTVSGKETVSEMKPNPESEVMSKHIKLNKNQQMQSCLNNVSKSKEDKDYAENLDGIHVNTTLSLQRDLEISKSLEKAEMLNLQETIVEAKKFLPEELIYQKKFEFRLQNEERLRKVRLLMIRLLKHSCNRVVSAYWIRWGEFILEIKELEQQQMARIIQMFWWQSLGRIEIRERLKQIELQQTRTETELTFKIELRIGKALLIQTNFRGFLGRKKGKQARVLLAATVMVQCAWRAKKCRVVLNILKAAKLHRNRSATTIECMMRCHWARIRRRLLNNIFKLEQKQKLIDFLEEQLRKKFQKYGAAILIQQWWRALQRKLHTRAIVTVLKRRAAIRIQQSYRSYRARRHLKQLVAEKREYDERILKSVRILQCNFRKRNAINMIQSMRDAIEEKMNKRNEERESQMQEKIKYGINITKANRMVYKLKKKIDPTLKAREERASLKIQKVFRGFRARKRCKVMKIKNMDVLRRFRRQKAKTAALALQSAYRGWKDRAAFKAKQREVAALTIQNIYRGTRAKRLVIHMVTRNHAAKTIQRIWRGKMYRSFCRVYKEQKTIHDRVAIMIQKRSRIYLAKVFCKNLIEKKRRKAEIQIKGSKEAKAAFDFEADRVMIYNGFHGNVRMPGAIQDTFRYWGNQSGDSLSGEKFSRMMRETPKMLEEKDKLDRNEVDLIFARNKQPDKRALNLHQFVDALVAVGNIKFKESDETFAYRHHKGKEAKVLALFRKYFFKSSWGKKVKKSLEELTHNRFDEAVGTIQCMYRIKQAKKLYGIAKEAYRVHLIRKAEDKAATFVQTLWRKRHAKKAMNTLLNNVIQKYVDPDSGQPYWYNSRTGESQWDKPRLLGKGDVNDTIKLPDPKEEFVVDCNKCHSTDASILCLDCLAPFCDDCFRIQHLKGSNTDHTTKSIVICSQCSYQAATRRCMTCLEYFCCTCFENYHSNKNLNNHSWLPVVVQCVECEIRAVKWRCDDCGGDSYCTKCFESVHAKGRRRTHQCVPLPYFTIELQQKEIDLKQEKEDRMLQEHLRKLQQQREEELTLKTVLFLQSRWRGRKDREKGKEMLRAYRLDQRQIWYQNKQDTAARKKVSYKLKNIVGMAPILKTDDEETKRKKKLGWMGTKVGSFAVKSGVVTALPKGDILPGKVCISKGDTRLTYYGEISEETVSKGHWISIKGIPFQISKISQSSSKEWTFVLDSPLRVDDFNFATIYHLGELTATQQGMVETKRGLNEKVGKVSQLFSSSTLKTNDQPLNDGEIDAIKEAENEDEEKEDKS